MRGRMGLGLTLGGVVLAVATGALVGLVSSSSAQLALPLAVALFVLVLSAIDPRVLLVLAVPGALLLMFRVGGDLVSFADVLLAGATVVALVLVRPRGTAALRAMLWSGTAYLALTIPTLILNPYAANYIEWVHEVVLVLGSMIVGYALGLSGGASAALWLYVIGSSIIAVVAVTTALIELAQTGTASAAYVLGLHKNFIGGSLATAAVIAFARPPWMGGSPRWAYLLGTLCLLGVIAAQSRQAIAAAVVGLAVVAFSGARQHRWLRLLMPVAAVVAAVQLTISVDEQLSSDNSFNSASVRLNIYDRSFDIWLDSPLFGAGMRWWYTDRYPGAFQPPNALIEVLTTTGIAGLIGFIMLFVGVLVVLAKLEPVYRTVAIAVIITRLTQAQFDLYWVAGQASMLWIVAGIAVGVRERDRECQRLVVPDTEALRLPAGAARTH